MDTFLGLSDVEEAALAENLSERLFSFSAFVELSPTEQAAAMATFACLSTDDQTGILADIPCYPANEQVLAFLMLARGEVP